MNHNKQILRNKTYNIRKKHTPEGCQVGKEKKRTQEKRTTKEKTEEFKQYKHLRGSSRAGGSESPMHMSPEDALKNPYAYDPSLKNP